jgi:hypothetical protein
MNYTYKITSLLSIVEWQELTKAIFPNYNGQPASFNGTSFIVVTFESPQTPADLGPLIKVELISE